MDLYTLIIMVIAIVIILRFLRVLGRKKDDDPPYIDWYGGGNQTGRAGDRQDDDSYDNITPINSASQNPEDNNGDIGERPKQQPSADDWQKMGVSNQAVIRALEAIMSVDSYFTANQFMLGARTAYEAIVTAFAAGDRDTLQSLLSKEVYDRFIDVIEHRGKSGKKVELTFVGIRDSSFKSASLSGNNARITIKFVSEIISATYDSDGKVIEGDPARVVTVDDIWTFARELESEDVNWLLISTSNVDVDSL